jgi:hypothetical protein
VYSCGGLLGHRSGDTHRPEHGKFPPLHTPDCPDSTSRPTPPTVSRSRLLHLPSLSVVQTPPQHSSHTTQCHPGLSVVQTPPQHSSHTTRCHPGLSDKLGRLDVPPRPLAHGPFLTLNPPRRVLTRQAVLHPPLAASQTPWDVSPSVRRPRLRPPGPFDTSDVP